MLSTWNHTVSQVSRLWKAKHWPRPFRATETIRLSLPWLIDDTASKPLNDQHRKVHLTRDGIVIDGVNSPITIKTGGTVDVKGQAINLTASNIKLKASNIALDSPMVNSSGAMKSVGDVSGAGISLSRHTHQGDSGGTTSTPN